MPFPKTWVEELIIEWLHLDGFLVEANLPVGVSKPGGRKEADVLGARINNGKLEIVHIETGQLSSGENTINSVRKKFSDNICESVSNYFKQKFDFTGNDVDYEKIYIATYWTQPTMERINASGVTVEKLPDFICNWIIPTIERWREDPPHKPRTKGENITLPESYWLLNLIDHLNYFKKKKMLNCMKD